MLESLVQAWFVATVGAVGMSINSFLLF